MADIFGNGDLFAEFDRTNDRSDRILMSKFEKDVPERSEPAETDVNEVGSEKATSKHTFFTDSESDSDSDSVSESRRPDLDRRGNAEEAAQKHAGVEEIEKLLSTMENAVDRETVASLKGIVNKLQSEVQKLRKERDRLNRVNRIINPNRFMKHENGPALQVLYMNSGISSKYRSTVEQFLGDLMRDKDAITRKLDDSYVRNSSLCLDARIDQISSPSERKKRLQAALAVGCSQLYEDFALDSMGWPRLAPTNDAYDIPQYQQVFFTALPLEDEDDTPKKEKRQKSTCFNCGESHMIKDCKIPMDPKKIGENRRKFQSQNKSFQQKPGGARYHAEDDPRFAKFKAGMLSNELRDALGLQKRDLPSYIYQMRMLGYPPGHMQALSEAGSGLSMFDKHGKEVATDGDSPEEGETDANTSVEVVDCSKIISYPGFNVPAGKEFYDDYRKLGMPPMNRAQSREMMVDMFSERQGSKRSHRDADIPEGGSASKRKRVEKTTDTAAEMDISFDEPTPKKNSHKLARADTEILAQSSPKPGSPACEVLSLEDLERQKIVLQEQLANSEGSDADVAVIDSYTSQTNTSQDSDLFVPPLPPTPVRPPLPTNTPPCTPPANRSGTVFKTPDGPPRLLRTPSSGGSRSMSLGTPVSESHGGETHSKGLPKPSSFAEGITQHIPFENLPGTVGTFERMKGLIDRIRAKKDSDRSADA